MEKRELKLKKKALRIDRRLEGSIDVVPIFDLELLHRSFCDSLLVAKLFRRPAKYLRGPSARAGTEPDRHL
jgi:hypothetical protein